MLMVFLIPPRKLPIRLTCTARRFKCLSQKTADIIMNIAEVRVSHNQPGQVLTFRGRLNIISPVPIKTEVTRGNRYRADESCANPQGLLPQLS